MKGRRVLVIDDVITAGESVYTTLTVILMAVTAAVTAQKC
jgi:orotate phosphoribosyltransferase